MKFLNLSILLVFIILGCNQHKTNNKREISSEIPSPNIVDSLAKIQCECYKNALKIEDDIQMKLFGLNSYSSLTNYLKHMTYKGGNLDLKAKYEKNLNDLVSEKVYKNCPSFFTFASKLNHKRVISKHLRDNPELIEIVKTGKFQSWGVDEDIVLTVTKDFVRTDYNDLNYYSISKIEWIDKFSYYEIFKESNHPFDSWRNVNDTIRVQIIDINDSIIHYDQITSNIIYPGVLKRIE